MRPGRVVVSPEAVSRWVHPSRRRSESSDRCSTPSAWTVHPRRHGHRWQPDCRDVSPERNPDPSSLPSTGRQTGSAARAAIARASRPNCLVLLVIRPKRRPHRGCPRRRSELPRRSRCPPPPPARRPGRYAVRGDQRSSAAEPAGRATQHSTELLGQRRRQSDRCGGNVTCRSDRQSMFDEWGVSPVGRPGSPPTPPRAATPS